jgi:putative multiple sugar transport system substrate-binding protein
MNRIAKIFALALVATIVAAPTFAQKKGNVGVVGIAMPTQSSARWIADGGNMKKILEERGYKVDYYATFDNFKVGVLQGGYIVKALGLDKGKNGPFNIELFAGSPDDTNAGYFFNGAMSQLNPYIKSGVLKVRSGQTDFAKVATLRWLGEVAQRRMDDILTSKYTDAKVDAVLSPYDGISIGILSSLKSVGYGTAKKPLPIVTGQDAEIPSVKSILAGEQTSTVFKDTRTLAKRAADMVDSVLKGTPAEINDTKTYNNGVKIVPSYLCDPISVDKTNIKAALVDIGYYTADQIGLK